MGNRFAEKAIEKKTTVPVAAENVKKEGKYKLMVRVGAELEEPLKAAAADMGLPVARFVELALREKLKDCNRL